MTNNSLFHNLLEGKLVARFPAYDYITEDIEVLKKDMISLGAKITSGYFSLRRSIDVTALQFFNEPLDTLKEEAVILPGLDHKPLYVILNNVSDIFRETKDDILTSIIWVNGGSTNIDIQYYRPLKKYWLKKRKISAAFDFSNKQKEVIEELLKVEEFPSLYREFLRLREEKNNFVKKQDFDSAAHTRDEEKAILVKIDVLFEGLLKKFFTETFL